MHKKTFDPNAINYSDFDLSFFDSLTQGYNKIMFDTSTNAVDMVAIIDAQHYVYRDQPTKNSHTRMVEHLRGCQKQGCDIIINDRVVSKIPTVKPTDIVNIALTGQWLSRHEPKSANGTKRATKKNGFKLLFQTAITDQKKEVNKKARAVKKYHKDNGFKLLFQGSK